MPAAQDPSGLPPSVPSGRRSGRGNRSTGTSAGTSTGVPSAGVLSTAVVLSAAVVAVLVLAGGALGTGPLGTGPLSTGPIGAGPIGAGLLGATPPGEPDEAPAVAACTGGTPVHVVVDPTLAPSVQRAVEEAEGRVLDTGVCADVSVVAQDSASVASDIAAATVAADLPHLWVPDSSMWLGRAVPATAAARTTTATGPFALTRLDSLVSTPVVLATSPAVATGAGWAATGPTWAAALASPQGLALPELSGSAVGLQALVALRSGTTDPEVARDSLTTAALAVQRGRVEDAAGALRLVVDGGSAAPIVPTTEQQVFVVNRGAAATPLVAVQPVDGRTSLDYPVVRVDRPASDVGADAAAVEGVVRLLEGAGREAALLDGFRAPLPVRPEGSTGPTPVLPVPSVADVDLLLTQLAELSRPSRVLAVLDASVSMRGVTGSGATRAQITQDAAGRSLDLFPDTATIGLWFFAVGMGEDGEDHVEVVPLAPLDPGAGGQREALAAGVDSLSDRLTPGGTGLYDTTLAAVRALRAEYDPAASNSVVLVTDGREQDPSGISRDELLQTLRAEADPERPVRVIAIGISDDVDAEQLTAVAEVTGGAAYLAERPEDFQTVLLDALRRR